MAENIIYCYSGSGHCLAIAKTIAKILGDTDIGKITKKRQRYPNKQITPAELTEKVLHID